MQRNLFNTLLAIVVAVVTTALGAYIYNLAISPDKELVFVKYLLTATCGSVVALMLDIARRWFVVNKVSEGVNDVLLDAIGAAVVMNSESSARVDSDLKDLEDYMEEHIIENFEVDELAVEKIKAQIINRVKKYKRLKFQTSEIADSIPQVRNQ